MNWPVIPPQAFGKVSFALTLSNMARSPDIDTIPITTAVTRGTPSCLGLRIAM